MTIKIFLEPESQSCKGIYALRHRYQLHAPFVLALYHEFIYNRSNIALIARKLPRIAATHVPFDMEFYNLHRTSQTEKKAVKYCVASEELQRLRRDLQIHLADAVVFSNTWKYKCAAGEGVALIHSLGYDLKLRPEEHNKTCNVPVKTQITDDDEADRILKEVAKIDPKTLGNLRAIGLRLELKRSKFANLEIGGLFPFGGNFR
jgi:hypothetical protein